MVPGNEIPAHHPVRELFLTLTHRGLRESHLSDEEIHLYLSNLLVEFVHMENMYKVRDESGQRVEYLTDMLGVRKNQVRLTEVTFTSMSVISRSSC